MTRANPLQPSFGKGEISPLLYGRVDLQQYGVAAKGLLNVLVRLQGPVSRRSGTRYVAEVKTSANSTRLVPFEFSTTQAYILELGNLYSRFYRNEGRIESGGSPVELTTPYATADLFQLKFAQSADTLYVAHPSYAPRKITRTSHTAWTITAITFTDGPYLDENTSTTTLALSGTSGSVTVTASASTFASTDVGRLIRWKDPANNWTWLTITAYTNATTVTATISGPNASAGTATASWRLGAWSATTGYPGCVTFHEERLWWGGNTNQPQTVWSSKSGDFENMAPSGVTGTVADDSAVTFTLGANQVNVIRWIESGSALQIGTIGGLWILRASATDEALTPTNVQAKLQRANGSANIAPKTAGDAILFVSRSGKKVREMAYSFERDKFVAPDMTILAEHVTGTGIVEVAYAEEPDSTLWAVRSDGYLLGMTYEREQEVVAWHRHKIGGVFGTGNAVVESVAVIPSPNGDHSQVWMIVKRTINSATERYVEFMEQVFASSDDQTDAFFVDSGLTYDSTPATTISGLSHLEGQTVAVLADGATHPDKTVSGGSITLERSASTVHVGLAYNSDVELLRPEAGAAAGTSQGQTKRIHGVTLRLQDTLGAFVGPDSDNLDEIQFRSGSDDMDSAPPLFSGDKYIPFDGKYGTDGYVFIRQSYPLPFTLLSVMPRLVTTER